MGKVAHHRVALVALALGACVYLLLRPNEAWFLERLDGVPFLGSTLRAVRIVTVPFGTYVPSLLLDVLPDFAWALALGSTLEGAWRGEVGRARIVWCLIGLVATIAYELAQRWRIVPGTFDPYDLLAQGAGYALGWRLNRYARASTVLPSRS